MDLSNANCQYPQCKHNFFTLITSAVQQLHVYLQTTTICHSIDRAFLSPVSSFDVDIGMNSSSSDSDYRYERSFSISTSHPSIAQQLFFP